MSTSWVPDHFNVHFFRCSQSMSLQLISEGVYFVKEIPVKLIIWSGRAYFGSCQIGMSDIQILQGSDLHTWNVFATLYKSWKGTYQFTTNCEIVHSAGVWRVRCFICWEALWWSTSCEYRRWTNFGINAYALCGLTIQSWQFNDVNGFLWYFGSCHFHPQATASRLAVVLAERAKHLTTILHQVY